MGRIGRSYPSPWVSAEPAAPESMSLAVIGGMLGLLAVLGLVGWLLISVAS